MHRFTPALLAILAGITLVSSDATVRAQSPLPKIRLNRAVETLAKGQSIFGLISSDRSLENARNIAASDVDFVIIDMEHGTFDLEKLQTFLVGMTSRAEIARKGNLQPNVTPIVLNPPARHPVLFIYWFDFIIFIYCFICF